MPEEMTPISRAVSDILTGAYNKKRLTQEVVAERAGMSVWTLQRKLKAKAPITATDLVILSKAIGISPAEVIEEAQRDVEHAEKLVSAGIPTLTEQRIKKRPSEMTEEELDAFEGESAANTDPEMGYDEPESP